MTDYPIPASAVEAARDRGEKWGQRPKMSATLTEQIILAADEARGLNWEEVTFHPVGAKPYRRRRLVTPWERQVCTESRWMPVQDEPEPPHGSIAYAEKRMDEFLQDEPEGES